MTDIQQYNAAFAECAAACRPVCVFNHPLLGTTRVVLYEGNWPPREERFSIRLSLLYPLGVLRGENDKHQGSTI